MNLRRPLPATVPYFVYALFALALCLCQPQPTLAQWTTADGSGNINDPNWHRALFSPRYLQTTLQQAGLIDVVPMDRSEVRGYDHGWINLGMKGFKPPVQSALRLHANQFRIHRSSQSCLFRPSHDRASVLKQCDFVGWGQTLQQELVHVDLCRAVNGFRQHRQI